MAQNNDRKQVALISAENLDALFGKTRESFKQVVATLPPALRLDFNREVGFAKDLVLRGNSSEKLRKANPATLVATIRNIASVGLTLNPIKQHCTIVPRWNFDSGEFEAHYMPMYRGLVHLGTQAGVQDIVVEVVYSADEFTVERTDKGDEYRHKIAFAVERETDGNKFQGVYVAARMPGSGKMKVEWIPSKDIYKMRANSDSYKDKEGKIRENSPWVVWFDEQAKKSALKRASKRWEEAIQPNEYWNAFQQAVSDDNTLERGRTFDGEATDVTDRGGKKVELLSPAQVGQVEAAFSKAKVRVARILTAYNVRALGEIPAEKFEELMERAATAQKALDEKAKGKGTGGKSAESADQKDKDKPADSAAAEGKGKKDQSK